MLDSLGFAALAAEDVRVGIGGTEGTTVPCLRGLGVY